MLKRYLLGWFQEISTFCNVFVGYLINEDEDCFGRLVRLFGNHLGDALAYLLFLIFCEGTGDPYVNVGHDDSFSKCYLFFWLFLARAIKCTFFY